MSGWKFLTVFCCVSKGTTTTIRRMEEKKAKMLKFIMGKGHQHSAERLKVQKELFKFSRVSFHIFFYVQCSHIMVNVWILTTHFMETSNSNVKEHDLFTYLFIFSNRTFGILVITIISNLDNIIFKKFKYEKYWNVIIVCIMHHIRNAELLMSHLMLSMKFLGI